MSTNDEICASTWDLKLSKKLALVDVDLDEYRRNATEGSIGAPNGPPELPDRMQSPLPFNFLDFDIPLALVQEGVLKGATSGSNGKRVDRISIVNPMSRTILGFTKGTTKKS